ncbi:ABC transporter ATP-binding protein [Erysipelothrix sp. HDW6C]|uniref:ABC transporter ATP-binding protein n=1 Tax=Erysipelothrix sp. HDW6C TaxID=2714930 RepID=UPI00140771FD|nr:ABC transporter ATP-binding protein [Erysipelothrix sp. HDW6C]QIK70823.1 ABC transporter ATP-binding protein [Erysipelothrix sp. HDW6C]
MIRIENLSKFYGKKAAIKDVCLEISDGEIYGFIGPNGAGKSTTIKAMLNYIFADAGTVTIDGLDSVVENKTIKSLVGYVPSEVNFYPELTGYEVIALSMKFHGCTDDAYAHSLCREFQIDETKKMRDLSLGNKKKVAIVSALVLNPKILIMDEPTNGLDPLIQNILFTHLRKQSEAGVTVFISSHNLREIQEHCDRVAFIKDGAILKVINLDDYNLTGKFVSASGDVLELKKMATKILRDEDHKVSFIYEGDLNALLVALSKTALTDVTIEEVSIEHQFIEYYKEEADHAIITD